MTGGLLTLVSKGYMSQIITYQPEITFFKVMYKRHTSFAIEPVEQYFKNTPNFGTTVTVNLAKYGDLIGETYLIVDLPSIPQNTRTDIPSYVKKFSWVENIGYALIDEIYLEIGGIIIDKHYGEWLFIWNELSKGNEKKKALNMMVGNVKELTEFSNGKKSYRLQVPLSFWFCNDITNTLPIIAINHNEMKIHVKFNDFLNVHKVTPTHYLTIENEFVLFDENEVITQIVEKKVASAEYVYYDVNTKKLYINYISGTFTSWTNSNDKSKYAIIGTKTRFSVIPTQSTGVDVDIIIQDKDYFNNIIPAIVSSFALVKYVYLDIFERIKFMKSDIEFLVPLVIDTQDLALNTHNRQVKINFTQPTSEIIWRIILEKNINNNNFFNYTGDTGKNIMIKSSLKIDGNVTINEFTSDFYSYVQNYIFHTNSFREGLNMYSFSLNPEDVIPTGTVNFSQLENVTLQMTVDSSINYQNVAYLKVWGRIYNVLRIINGRASLAWVR
jgi:hypothetical protein